MERNGTHVVWITRHRSYYIEIIILVEDMRENIEYHGYDAKDKVIAWLWELLESFDKSKRAAFLQFVTGN